MLKLLLLFTIIGFSSGRRGPLWTIDSSSGFDDLLLKNISSLTFKHLIKAVNHSMVQLQQFANEKKTLQDTMEELKKLIAEEAEIKNENKERCKKPNQSKSCFSCYKKVCYDHLEENCDLFDLLMPESMMSNNKPDSKKEKGLNMKGDKEVDEIDEQQQEKLAELEKMMEEDSAMSNFDNLMEELGSDMDWFSENEMIEDVGNKTMTTMDIFGDDMAELYFNSADFFSDGSTNTMETFGDGVDEMELLMKDMDKRIDELKQFQFDKEWKEQWDAHYERSQKALLDVKSGLDLLRNAAEYGADTAQQKLLDNNQDVLGTMVEKTSENTVKTVNKVLKKFSIWKRDTEEASKRDNNSPFCQQFVAEGEYSFCKKYETDKKCKRVCAPDEEDRFCKDIAEREAMQSHTIEMLTKSLEEQHKRANNIIKEHSWPLIMKTMNFNNKERDYKKIPIESIEIDPQNYDQEKPWLFKDVIIRFSLKHNGGDPKYHIQEKKTKLTDPVNLMNTFNINATKPFAKAVIGEMNTKYLEEHPLK